MGVSSSMYIGVSGLNSFSTALGVVGDNIANANTTGFKSSSVRFGDMVSSYYSTQSKDTDREGAGSSIMGIQTDFGMGPMVQSDFWSDMAINGDGFFNVLTPGNETLYTRDGSFHMDDSGQLVTFQGHQVLNSAGAALVVDNPQTPVYKNYYVSTDGWVYGTNIATGAETRIPNTQLRLSTFPNPGGLIGQGSNLFSLGPESGSAVNGTPNDGTRGTIRGRTVEGSNTDIAAEMVNMIIYQADYNANSKTISTASQMLDTVVNLIR